jgi:hypothetical protein
VTPDFRVAKKARTTPIKLLMNLFRVDRKVQAAITGASGQVLLIF